MKQPQLNPTEIGNRLELFVDDTLIESLNGATLKMHSPQKAYADKNILPPHHYGTVIWDKEMNIYRAYYRHDICEFTECTCYAESKDGKEWYMPDLNIFPDDLSGMPNVVIPHCKERFAHNFSPFLDTNPQCDPQERFKALAGYCTKPDANDGHYWGLQLFVSPDGIHWSQKTTDPVIPYVRSRYHDFAFDSQNVAFWSEAEGQYVAYFRYYIEFSADEPGKAPLRLRTIGRATAQNPAELWNDECESFEHLNFPKEDIYTSQTAPYYRAPHIYIATGTRYAKGWLEGNYTQENFDNNLGATDIMLFSTRQGSDHFDRLFHEAFLRPGTDIADWRNRGNYLALNWVPTGDNEISGYNRNGIRYTLRTDGFVSVNASAAGGEMVTKPIIFNGKDLILNYSTSAMGRIRVELQDADGNPYEGFRLEDCITLSGDSIERKITWKNAQVSDLIGKPTKIRFVMTDADLYSYRFN